MYIDIINVELQWFVGHLINRAFVQPGRMRPLVVPRISNEIAILEFALQI